MRKYKIIKMKCLKCDNVVEVKSCVRKVLCEECKWKRKEFPLKEGMIENIDYVICQVCGYKSIELQMHIKKHHGLTGKEYKEKFPGNKLTIVSKETRDKIGKSSKGKTYEERYGVEEAKRLKNDQSEKMMGHEVTEETRDKIRKKLKGKKYGSNVERFGEEKAKEISKNMSDSKMGKKLEEICGSKERAEEVSKILSESHKGLTPTDEARKNMSKAQKTPEARKRKIEFMKTRVGELSPNWQGGKNSETYGPEFNDRLRQQIFERDHGICQVCKLHKEQLQFLFKRNNWIFHIHHIDYNKKNNDPINLLLLCIKCHLITNGNRNYWENYFKSLIGNKSKELIFTSSLESEIKMISR